MGADSASDSQADQPQVNAYFALVLAPIIALVGIVVGQLLPEYLSTRRTVRDRYDAAISAVAGLQAARHAAGVNVPSQFLKPVNEQEEQKAVQELSTEGVRSFLAAAASARKALSALHPYSPDLKPYWDKFEVPEAELDELVDLLYERRKKPLKRYAGS